MMMIRSLTTSIGDEKGFECAIDSAGLILIHNDDGFARNMMTATLPNNAPFRTNIYVFYFFKISGFCPSLPRSKHPNHPLAVCIIASVLAMCECKVQGILFLLLSFAENQSKLRSKKSVQTCRQPRKNR